MLKTYFSRTFFVVSTLLFLQGCFVPRNHSNSRIYQNSLSSDQYQDSIKDNMSSFFDDMDAINNFNDINNFNNINDVNGINGIYDIDDINDINNNNLNDSYNLPNTYFFGNSTFKKKQKKSFGISPLKKQKDFYDLTSDLNELLSLTKFFASEMKDRSEPQEDQGNVWVKRSKADLRDALKSFHKSIERHLMWSEVAISSNDKGTWQDRMRSFNSKMQDILNNFSVNPNNSFLSSKIDGARRKVNDMQNILESAKKISSFIGI